MSSNLICHKKKEPILKIDDFQSNTCSYIFMNGICDDWANYEVILRLF